MSNPASVTNISKVKFKTSKTVMAQASEDATPFYIPVVAYDTDAEQQKLNPLSFGTDELSDTGVENIIIPVQAYDTDAFQQIQWPEWIKDYEDFDTYQFIAPIQLYVLSIYKIGTAPTVECVVEVDPTVSFYDVTSANTCSASVQTSPSVDIYDIVCKPTVTCGIMVTV